MYNSYVGFKTLLRREIVRIMRIWPQTLLPPIITMSLYFMIFGTFIGAKVGLIKGVSYISFRFEWNSDAFGSIPTVNAIVKGKKVYNPNLDGTKTGGTGSHREDTNSTWEYSDNPIYQLLDYLRNDRYGMGIAKPVSSTGGNCASST